MTNRKNYLTLISTFSCIAVVFLHTNICFHSFSTERYWISANIIECFFYFAVPCFFMISGATLMDYREKYSLKEYFIRRIRKTVIPFLFWCIAGMFFDIFVLKSIDPAELNLRKIYTGIFNSEFVDIYWFFPAIISVYLSIPLFAAVEKKARKEIFTYLAIAGFIVNVFIAFLLKIPKENLILPMGVDVVSLALLYVVTGYLICTYDMPKAMRIIVYILGGVGFAMHCIGTYVLSMRSGMLVSAFKGYFNIPAVLHSIGIFTWFRYNGDRIMNNAFISKIVSLIAPYTLGVYLLQYFIYSSMIKYLNIQTTSLVYRLGAPFIIIPVAVFINWVFKKIPVLKHLVP